MVKYAHEKLDVRHSQERNFDKLNFNLLIAGELELASRDGVMDEERLACLNIAKTICYHKQYLNDHDLRTGYDNVLKKVEQGVKTWTDGLEHDLHEIYDYRATVLMREKLQNKDEDRNDRKKNESSNSFSSNQSSASTQGGGQGYNFEDMDKNKPVFCMEYNKNRCTHEDTHEGHFGGRKCLKWHICRCRRFGEIRHHPEDDEKCQRKA